MKSRDLSFTTLDEILADIHALPSEGLTASGNWSPAGNVDHVAKFLRFSAEGFPEGKPPLTMRLAFRLMIKVLGKRLFLMKLKPGRVKLPAAMDWAMPEEGLAWPDAVKRLEDAVASAKRHGMKQPSPIAGHLSEERWTMLHCRHAEMHLGLIQLPGETTGA